MRLGKKSLLVGVAGLTVAVAGAVGVAGATDMSTATSNRGDTTVTGSETRTTRDSSKSGTASRHARTGIVPAGTRLKAGDSVKSRNGKYTLQQQSDGNLVLVNSTGKAAWSSQTHDHPGAYSQFQTDGNLVVYSKRAKVLFTSATERRGKHLVLQDDGNLVIYNADKKGIWASEAQVFTLYPGQRLRPGQLRRSPDGDHALVMQRDGNLVVYNSAKKKPLWSSQTHEHRGAWVSNEGNGNIVIRSAGGKVLWQSATNGNRRAKFLMQNDGNAVVYRTNGKAVWGTTTHKHALLPGQTLTSAQYRISQNGRYRLDMQGDGNLVVRDLTTRKALWSSRTHDHDGARVTLQRDGNVVIYIGSRSLWSTKTDGRSAASLQIQDDGNLVLYDVNKRAIWDSGTGR